VTYRSKAKRIDANQPEIVKALRKISGVSVELDRDDIIVGYRGQTYWFEIKDPSKTMRKDGTVPDNDKHIKKSQKRMLEQFTGHYAIVWSLDDILDEMGIKSNPEKLCGTCWLNSPDDDPRCRCK
jgi:hypothetical protein